MGLVALGCSESSARILVAYTERSCKPSYPSSTTAVQLQHFFGCVSLYGCWGFACLVRRRYVKLVTAAGSYQ